MEYVCKLFNRFDNNPNIGTGGSEQMKFNTNYSFLCVNGALSYVSLSFFASETYLHKAHSVS